MTSYWWKALAAGLMVVVWGVLEPWQSMLAAAQERGVQLMLSQAVQLDFMPQEAFFLLDLGRGDMRRLRAVVVPRYEDSTGEKTTPHKWILGAEVAVGRLPGTLEYSVVVVGADNRFYFVPPRRLSEQEIEHAARGVDDLRQISAKLKDVLRSWELQIRAQEQSLDRLRADADVIANLGRIVEVKEETEKVRLEVASLSKDIDRLQRFLRLVKQRSGPGNFVGRENQLTRQLAELAQAASATESGEVGRRALSEQDLQRKLAILEATRMDDYDALQRRLIRIRKQRMQLEASRSQDAALGSGTDATAPHFESPEDYLR